MLRPEEQQEIDQLQAQIVALFEPIETAWADGTPKNVLDNNLAYAEMNARPLKARIASIKRAANKRDK